LKGILDFDPDVDLRRNKRAGRIDVDAYGQRVPLEHSSDGYQSVLGLAVDVMSVVMFHLWPSMEVAEGIVNIDELGAHLLDHQGRGPGGEGRNRDRERLLGLPCRRRRRARPLRRHRRPRRPSFALRCN